MRRERRPAVNKFVIAYEHNGKRIEYVGRTLAELAPEYRRIVTHLKWAIRELRQLRSPNPWVVATLVQLQTVPVIDPMSCAADQVAYEIAQVSFIMEDALNMLAHLKHSTVERLEAARFALTYGQTPKRRDLEPVIQSAGYDVEEAAVAVAET